MEEVVKVYVNFRYDMTFRCFWSASQQTRGIGATNNYVAEQGRKVFYHTSWSHSMAFSNVSYLRRLTIWKSKSQTVGHQQKTLHNIYKIQDDWCCGKRWFI